MTVSMTPNNSGSSILEVQTLGQILSDAVVNVFVTQIQSQLSQMQRKEKS